VVNKKDWLRPWTSDTMDMWTQVLLKLFKIRNPYTNSIMHNTQIEIDMIRIKYQT